MRQIPIGVQDFKAVRDGDFYYVDKSMLIARILQENDRGVFLYTRPRRFGKSLNLSMLDAFFNIEYKGNTWFDKLKISEYHDFDDLKNTFPVIYMDLRFESPADFNAFLRQFNDKLFYVFDHFSYLEDSPNLSSGMRDRYRKLASTDSLDVEDSKIALTRLCSMLEQHHGSKVIVLMDEYDHAVNSITDQVMRRQIIDFLRGFLSPLLKGNPSLQLGVVTGIMQITKENIFSGLNNLSVNNILSKDFDEMFGFTDDEVKQICEDYGHPEKFEEAKNWYDGYRFGNVDIYNPWSILNYVKNKFEPAPYWVNTSGNSIINDLVSRSDEETLENLKDLASGKGMTCELAPSMTFEDLDRKSEAIYSLMAVSGYLKAVPVGDGLYNLSIPNRELYSVFSDEIFRSLFNGGGVRPYVMRFAKATVAGDTDGMEKNLYEILVKVISGRVLDNEHSYQAFIAGMMSRFLGNYDITADFESGRGYHDMIMRRKSGTGYNAVLEFKITKSDSELESAAKDALKQIKDKDYAHGLEGKTIIYGVGICSKLPFILSEKL